MTEPEPLLAGARPLVGDPDGDDDDTRPRTRHRTGWLRAVLLAGYAVIAATALAVGQFDTPLADLERAVAEGRVTTVTSAGAMGPGTTGYGTQEITWRQGGLARRTEVRVVSPGEQAPDSDLPVAVRDVVPQLRQVAPDLVVLQGTAPDAWSEVWGARTPPWVGFAWLALVLATLGLLLRGPQPWRATRWAWFWVFWLPGGQLALLALSGPAPLLPAPGPRARRLTGGWAFLGLLVVNAVT